MKIFIKIIISSLVLFLSGCLEHNNPVIPSGSEDIIHDLIPTLGEVRDIFIDKEDSIFFIGTESQGLAIYKLNNNFGLDSLYENDLWGVGKDIRSVYYDNGNQLVYALDRFGYVYHEYLPNILDGSLDTLSQINCGATSTHATKFVVDEQGVGGNPDIYALYKHNADNELYLENSFSEMKQISYNFLFDFENDVNFHDCFDAFNQNDTLFYGVSDLHYNQNKIFISNLDSNVYSYGVFEENGNILDLDTVESKVLSIYSFNDFIFNGLKDNGCYITLLNGDSFSDDATHKLHIAEGLSVLDIYYDVENSKLLLSCGSGGVLVYNWDGQSFNFNEQVRLFSSYAFTAKIFEHLIYIATKNGLEIFNIGD